MLGIDLDAKGARIDQTETYSVYKKGVCGAASFHECKLETKLLQTLRAQ